MTGGFEGNPVSPKREGAQPRPSTGGGRGQEPFKKDTPPATSRDGPAFYTEFTIGTAGFFPSHLFLFEELVMCQQTAVQGRGV